MKKIVVLKYEKNTPAPKVLAKEKGYFVNKLLEIAFKNNIPVVKNNELTDTLYSIEEGSYIPEELFEIVAQIYAFIYTEIQK